MLQGGDDEEGGAEGARVAQVGCEQRGVDAALQRLHSTAQRMVTRVNTLQAASPRAPLECRRGIVMRTTGLDGRKGASRPGEAGTPVHTPPAPAASRAR